MDISRDDAAAALSDIASAQGRSRLLASYNIAGAILIVWGVVWLIAYTEIGLLPSSLWGNVWVPGDVIGILVTIVLSQRAGRRKGSQAQTKGLEWRIVGYMALGVIVCAGLFAMVRPQDVNVYMAFPGLLAGTVYAVIGLSRMTRYLWLGAAVIAASLVGFFEFASILPFWMAATGGGGLIVAGLLFRRP